MSRHTTVITDAMEQYVRQVSLREPGPLQRLRESTDDHPSASMQISPEQGQFLHFLVRLIGAHKALEIGVFMGYSSSWIASALPPDGKLVGCDVSDEFNQVRWQTWNELGVADKIDFRLSPALDTLDQLIAGGAAGTFDFAFIDADKPNYVPYYERCLTLLRTGGLIAVDNTLWHGDVVDAANTDVDTEAIREFNRHLHRDKRIALSLVTMGDGITLACKL